MPPAPLISPQPAARPGWRVWPALAVVLAVLLLHAALLGLLPQPAGAPKAVAAGAAPRALQLRQRVVPPAVLQPTLDGATPEAKPPSPMPRRPPRSRLARPPGPISPTPASTAPASDALSLAGAGHEGMAQAPGEAAPAAMPAGTPVPTYATRLPPPATLQYTVQRGAPDAGLAAPAVREGLQAQLIWRPDVVAASYTLSLGLGALGSASVGALDAHGMAPERHVETRRGREVRAANFQRQAGAGGQTGGRITFSGPRIEHPLLPGVQDRLSWMLQLAGVMAADTALAQPGAEVSLLVVGVRGDAALWRFRVQAVQTLPLPVGEVQNAVHLQREAQHAYDTRVDVWLDPARHHLPVRLRLQNRADGPGTEFKLLQILF